jgi:hypothetical protein
MKTLIIALATILTVGKLATGNPYSDGRAYMLAMQSIWSECQQYGYNTPECIEPDDDGGN